MEVGFSDGSCMIGIFFGGGGLPSSSEFCFLTPVFGQFHMRVQAVLAFQITRSLFSGFYRFPLGLWRLIDADPTFLYNYVGEVPVAASPHPLLQVAMNLFY